MGEMHEAYLMRCFNCLEMTDISNFKSIDIRKKNVGCQSIQSLSRV